MMKRTLPFLFAILLGAASAAHAYDPPYLGTSATNTNPRRQGEANTGLWTPSTGVIAFSSLGTTQAQIINTANASNYITLTGSLSGSPVVAVDGTSSNPALTLSGKGTGGVVFRVNGNTQASVLSSSNTVNSLTFAGAATNTPPSIGVTGSDTDVALTLTTQAAGGINLQTGGGGRQVRVAGTASAVDYIQLTGGATGTPGTVAASAQGSDADINFAVNPKGSGAVTSTGYVIPAGVNRVATQVDKTNATLGNVTGLTAPIKNGKTYSFRAVLHVAADATGGHKYAATSSGTVSAIIYEIRSLCNTTSVNVITSRQTTLGGSAGQAGCVDPFTVVDGTVTASSDGTLAIQFAQNTGSGTSSVLVGSSFIVQQIN